MERVMYTARIIASNGSASGIPMSKIVSQYDADTQEEVTAWAKTSLRPGQYAEILMDRPERKYGRYREIGVVRG